MDPQLKNKVVIITGASSGFGRGTAVQFSRLGCRLALIARRKELLEEVAAECRAQGAPQVLVCCRDVSIEEECVAVVQEIFQAFHGIDVLVNNAGCLSKRSTLVEATTEDFDKVMNINTRSIMTLTQQCIPHLTKSKGSVVNVSSILGTHAVPGLAPYNMSKAALDMLTRISSLELAEVGVRVNSVNPGVVYTEIFDNLGMSATEMEEFLKKGCDMHPMGRLGTIEEVANAIIFLASSLSSFTTGQLLYVDGGFHNTTSTKSWHF
ncbi:uncharacterized protein LOC111718210 [Eurytemora carolleeae]|uniref:uncharacterized protein LOC111718210 n=1 Tax=Eurytemora carolleeae TaxID=1294199 RepID=UPI000C78FA7A|nr:uncharacterized protein LOC111718210 [Eurytemora carolleeae]|eukprot:XP_023349517.1 uncharacterized protein LOC111718210 [Eurytemora affinis]